MAISNVDESSMSLDFQPESLNRATVEPLKQVDNHTLDLEHYISSYTGHTRIHRLLFIAKNCPNLHHDALQMALVDVRATLNVEKYVDICQLLGQQQDEDWVVRVRKERRIKGDALEGDLKASRHNLMKQSIRMGLEDLGTHHYKSGDLMQAFKCYAKSRDYCSSHQETINMCLNLIKVNIELGNWSQLKTVAERADAERAQEAIASAKGALSSAHSSASLSRQTQLSGSQEFSSSPILIGKLRCAMGLAHLSLGNYKKASRAFLSVPEELKNHYSEVISPSDIATYATLTALAALDRAEISSKLVKNRRQFEAYLELEPACSQMIQTFHNARYDATLQLLESKQADLLLDMHLHPHVEKLTALIKRAALLQYFEPFKSASLVRMAKKLRFDRKALEEEICKAIAEGHLNAKIDSKNDVLQATRTNLRANVIVRSALTGDEAMKKTRHLLLRFSCIERGLKAGDGTSRPNPQDPHQQPNRYRTDYLHMEGDEQSEGMMLDT